jgi:hypothetical protein
MAHMALLFTTSYLTDSLDLFRYYKNLAERAMARVSDQQLLTVLDGEANSIAVIVKHMAGNMRSRWTDFLTSDGEKPDRNRDTEFEDAPATREALLALWELRMAILVQRTRSAFRAGSATDRHHSRRSPFSEAGHQSPDGALFLPLRTDRAPRQALQACGVEIAERPAQAIRGLQSPRGSRGSQPAVTYLDFFAVSKHTGSRYCLEYVIRPGFSSFIAWKIGSVVRHRPLRGAS